MKKIYFLILAYIAIFATSCDDLRFGNDFLEKPVSDEINIDTVFTTKFFSDQVLAEVYKSLPDFLPSDGRLSWSLLEKQTDLAIYLKTVDDAYQTGQMNSSLTGVGPYPIDLNSVGAVGSPIYGIRMANIYLENIHKVVDMTNEEKEIRKAEAKLIVAFHYSQMLRHLGGMPWMSHTYKASDDLNMKRLTVEAMVDSIVSYTDQVAKVLPWSVSQENDGRMTAAAAKALKFRVLHFAASPLFNNTEPYLAGEAADEKYVWYGDYKQSRWQRALDAGLDFIQTNADNNNFYKLVDIASKSPGENFASAYLDRYNGEVLISSHRFTKYGTGAKYFAQIRFGTCCPNQNYADMFQMLDGTEFDWNNPDHVKNPFFLNFNPATTAVNIPRRDPRLYETLLVNGDKFQGRKAKVYNGGAEGPISTSIYKNLTINGIGMRKFVRDFGAEINGKFYQCPLMRLPEIYLGMAEIMNELGTASVKDKFSNDAYDYVNMIRSRVKMPIITSVAVASGNDLTNYILNERAREFGFEEVRYFDLVRRKRVDLFTRPIDILVVTLKNDGTYTYTKAPSTINRVWLDLWSNKYLLSPIPLAEINKKYGLVQNPGW